MAALGVWCWVGWAVRLISQGKGYMSTSQGLAVGHIWEEGCTVALSNVTLEDQPGEWGLQRQAHGERLPVGVARRRSQGWEPWKGWAGGICYCQSAQSQWPKKNCPPAFWAYPAPLSAGWGWCEWPGVRKEVSRSRPHSLPLGLPASNHRPQEAERGGAVQSSGQNPRIDFHHGLIPSLYWFGMNGDHSSLNHLRMAYYSRMSRKFLGHEFSSSGCVCKHAQSF